MAKYVLSVDDKETLEDFIDVYEGGLKNLERIKQLNVGDYLILYLDDHKGNMVLQKNSYGAPIKYKVVCSTEYGIPFVKRVNKKGNPIGDLYSCTGMADNDWFHDPDQKFNFELDPDYVDSLLIQDGYDPALLHKSKQDIWKAVTLHNRSCKITTKSLNDCVAFFTNVKVGDTLWTSALSSFLVQDKKTCTKQDLGKAKKWSSRTSIKGPFVTVLTVREIG